MEIYLLMLTVTMYYENGDMLLLNVQRQIECIIFTPMSKHVHGK